MAQEKELLLKDLCGRLPYGVICKTHFGSYELLGIDGTTLHLDSPIYDEGDGFFDLEYMEIQPYLRPMSSMTGVEEKIFLSLSEGLSYNKDTECVEYKTERQDWLNANHFDYRGLIPMGLALEAKDGIYDGIYNIENI